MSKVFTMRNGVLLFMALAIIFTNFSPVASEIWSGYLKAAAAAATGLAALFMHPPTLVSSPPQDTSDALKAANALGKP